MVKVVVVVVKVVEIDEVEVDEPHIPHLRYWHGKVVGNTRPCTLCTPHPGPLLRTYHQAH